ncbi:MAG: hypothetical protein EOM64_08165, partial [Erysipelotrichia bacterium]|nr:hypothetical protein [Erysipelotrichia bacterium]
MKKVFGVILCLLASAAIVFGLPLLLKQFSLSASAEVDDITSGILEQSVIRVENTPHEITKLYSAGHMVGVLNDKTRLNDFLASTYRSRYKADYPGSSCGLGKDVYLATEQSYFTYQDIDSQIFQYLDDNELFTLRATGVEFSDSNGIYAEIYVQNETMYEEAMQDYLKLFIASNELSILTSGQQTDALKSYGSRAVGISINQTITTKQTYASPSEIKTDKAQVLDYLEYGDNTERQYYTVAKYDTVAGVGSKNNGLSATQIMNINRDKISSTDQVLSEGEQLCVTYFNSPIDITITRESMKKEAIDFETIYEEDSTLREGTQMQSTAGVNGSRNALYTERWINGVLISGSLESSVDTLQPVSAVVKVGTMVPPSVGTGTFRWPVDNPVISCHWGCYYGHRAIDVQNSYDHYGNIYAADNGTVEVNSYNGVNGNYIIINHNNGYETYYGHMNVPSPLAIGTVVEKGDVIGQLGMTGAATGPHTHFFIMFNGDRRDPCQGFLDCTGHD